MESGECASIGLKGAKTWWVSEKNAKVTFGANRRDQGSSALTMSREIARKETVSEARTKNEAVGFALELSTRDRLPPQLIALYLGSSKT